MEVAVGRRLGIVAAVFSVFVVVVVVVCGKICVIVELDALIISVFDRSTSNSKNHLIAGLFAATCSLFRWSSCSLGLVHRDCE